MFSREAVSREDLAWPIHHHFLIWRKKIHGIQRPPALYCSEEDILDHLSWYEIPACEPLHDLSNVVQHIITELPSHFEDKSKSRSPLSATKQNCCLHLATPFSSLNCWETGQRFSRNTAKRLPTSFSLVKIIGGHLMENTSYFMMVHLVQTLVVSLCCNISIWQHQRSKIQFYRRPSKSSICICLSKSFKTRLAHPLYW